MPDEKQDATFTPYVSPDAKLREFTLRAALLGIIISVVFGAANAYLALKVSMTVSASIPAAVISMAILRGLLRSGTILENNMVQTIGSSGESLVAGVTFTIPALLFLHLEFTYFKIFLYSIAGSIIGVLLMIPLRYYLVNREHGKLAFPEGTACAEVLIAGQEKGSKAKYVFTSLFIGSVYKLVLDGFKLIKATPGLVMRNMHMATVRFELTPILLGVGYLIGPRIAAVMLAGGLMGWVVFLPLIHLIGEHLTAPIYPATIPIAQMSPDEIWNFYLRYIGAGGVAIGGFLSIIKSLPTIWSSFKKSFESLKSSLKQTTASLRTDDDLNFKYVIIGLVVVSALMLIIPKYHVNVLGLIIILIFSFFFVAVSSRIVGLLGSTAQPVSGMTISALIIVSVVFLTVYGPSPESMTTTISIAAIICIAICLSGDMAQDLKTGFLVGATPRKQQIGELLGTLFASLFVGLVVLLLHEAYTLGSAKLPAVQATLMADIVKGIMQNNLPWAFVFIGVILGLIVEMVGISALPFAIGLYLPISTSSPIIFGGLLFWLIDRLTRKSDPEEAKTVKERGTLFASGLIAGDALMGIMLALLTVFPMSADKKWVDYLMMRSSISGSILEDILSFAVYFLLIAFFFRFIRRIKQATSRVK